MKRIISLVCAMSMFLSLLTITTQFNVFADDNFTSFKEDFNSSAGGSVPDKFIKKEAGNCALSVVDVPDKSNKSLYMRSSTSSSAHIQFEVNNQEKTGMTLSFRIMIPKAQNLQIPTIIDSKG